MTEIKTVIGKNGRLVIPAAYRRALGLEPGNRVILILEEDGIRLVTARQAIQRSQALVRRYIAEDRSLSQELIQQRREEATRA